MELTNLPEDLFPGVVYLTEEQYHTLYTTGTITVGTTTLTYDPRVLYVTPDNITDLVNLHTQQIAIHTQEIAALDAKIDNEVSGLKENIDSDTLTYNNKDLTVIGVKDTVNEESKSAKDIISGTTLVIVGDNE